MKRPGAFESLMADMDDEDVVESAVCAASDILASCCMKYGLLSELGSPLLIVLDSFVAYPT